MQEFIDKITSQLGISADSAKKATGSVLGVIRQNAKGPQFQQFLDKIPGAGDLLSQFGGGGGKGGGLLGKLGGLFGGKAKAAADLVGSLSKAGLDGEKGANFLRQIVAFFKEKAGGDLVKKLLANIPALGKLVG